MHSRRRFRLVPSVQAGNIPQVDPNLWIVHYGPAEQNDRLPINMLPVSTMMHQIMNVRQQLFQMGQIARKEFMLSDRINWPHIPLPGRGQSVYPPPMPNRSVPQAMAYPPHPAPPVGPTPTKRRGGHAQGPPHPAPMMGAPFASVDSIIDDDEDISRGDLFDHLTPQEMSMHRYRQNHEWMEEIMSSPYRIGQIEVADLGLGRRGELSALTDGIFESQGAGNWEAGPKKPYRGHLDPELAAQFRVRAEKTAEANSAEIERLKVEHEKVLESFRGLAALKQAEQELRFAAEETGPEFWRLEGRLEDNDESSGRWDQHQNKNAEDILARVEEAIGRSAAAVRDVYRVQEGGYQEPAPEPVPEPVAVQPPQPQAQAPGADQAAFMSRQPSHAGSQNSGVMVGDSDIDMGGTAAGLLDQMHAGFSSTSTPVNNFPTPQPHLSAIPSSAATPANLNVPSPVPAPPPTSQPPPAASDDVRMEDADPSKGATTAPDHGTGSGDWVVVPKGGGSPASPSNQGPVNVATGAGAAAPSAHLPGSSKPASAAPTPADGLGFEGDNNDFSSLADLDTAGDALASYDPPSGDDAGGLGDLNMDLEDSAFGDAFHGDQQSAANTPGDAGM